MTARDGPVPVVHVITKLELGGAQQNTLHTVGQLDRARFAPQLVTGSGGMLEEEARALPDVPLHVIDALVRPVRPVADARAVTQLRGLLAPLAERGPVIVHTHSSKAGIVGRAAARWAGARPVVHSIHGFGHQAIRPLLRPLVVATERRMAAGTDAFISVSRRNADEARELGLLGDVPVHVIRSGIDVDAFARADALRAEARAELGVEGATPLVGMIACLKPQKAPLDFVDVCARVAAAQPDARFFLAGDGELRASVEAAIAERGLSGSFRLLGWRRDVPALLGALDVMVLTSRWEGLPRVCPQAMAAGRPIVATAVDGTPEAVVDARNGFLVEPGDTATAAERVLRLLGDPELRATMARAGREAVEEFRQETMVAQQEALYEELLAVPRDR